MSNNKRDNNNNFSGSSSSDEEGDEDEEEQNYVAATSSTSVLGRDIKKGNEWDSSSLLLFEGEEEKYLPTTKGDVRSVMFKFVLPRNRQFVVYNVFTDIARVFGYGKRRKKVAFTHEALENYEQKGDVAGKDRFVPTAKQPYKGIAASSKKRKLSAVYSSWTVKETEFVPRVDRIDDYSKFEYFCERHCIACDCCCSCCRNNKAPDLTNVMEGYLSDLNTGSAFLNGHATRTFESAMSTLEFVKLNAFSLTSMSNLRPQEKNYGKQKLSILSASIWMFGFSMRNILEMASEGHVQLLPSETGFKKLIEEFAHTCLSVCDGVKVVLQYSHNFHNFCEECIRILKILQLHIGFKADLKLKKPMRRGAGLELSKVIKKMIVMQKSVTVMVAKASIADVAEAESSLEWRSFQDLAGPEKVSSLKHLLTVTHEGIVLVQTQLRFLLDDIVDSVRDITEADLLFILADMYDRVRFLSNFKRKRVEAEMKQLGVLMTDFCRDFQSFINFGEHIMKRYVEFRDVLHVTFEYLVKGLKVDELKEILPSGTFKRKNSCRNFCDDYCCCFCCCCCCGKAEEDTKHMPKYKVADFFRVSYKEAVNCQIYANKYYFGMALSTQTIGEIIPKSIIQRWGINESSSPRQSLEDKPGEDEISEDEQPLQTLQVEHKPILVTSPATSPRTSIESGERIPGVTNPSSPPGSPRQSEGPAAGLESGVAGAGTEQQQAAPPTQSILKDGSKKKDKKQTNFK